MEKDQSSVHDLACDCFLFIDSLSIKCNEVCHSRLHRLSCQFYWTGLVFWQQALLDTHQLRKALRSCDYSQHKLMYHKLWKRIWPIVLILRLLQLKKQRNLLYMHVFSGWKFWLVTQNFDMSQNLKSQNYPFLCPQLRSNGGSILVSGCLCPSMRPIVKNHAC